MAEKSGPTCKFVQDFVGDNDIAWFGKENSEPYRPDGVSIHYERFMYKVEKKHRIPYKSLHKLRHSNATLLIDGGANPKVFQKNLGHEDVTMTLGTYAHAYSDRQRCEVDKLDSVISFDRKIC